MSAIQDFDKAIELDRTALKRTVTAQKLIASAVTHLRQLGISAKQWRSNPVMT